MALADALKWLQDVPGFEHRVLCGGNHDFILEQLGTENAQSLCRSYGVTYLFTEAPPVCLEFRSGLSATIWGSGVSGVAGLGAARAIQSGNNAFQIPIGDEGAFKAECEHLGVLKPEWYAGGGAIDLMLTHCPPEGCVGGAKGKTVECIRDLVRKAQPSLYICGHSHTDIKDPLKQIVGDVDGVLGVNAACLATWNAFNGMPIVVDRHLGNSEDQTFKRLQAVEARIWLLEHRKPKL